MRSGHFYAAVKSAANSRGPIHRSALRQVAEISTTPIEIESPRRYRVYFHRGLSLAKISCRVISSNSRRGSFDRDNKRSITLGRRTCVHETTAGTSPGADRRDDFGTRRGTNTAIRYFANLSEIIATLARAYLTPFARLYSLQPDREFAIEVHFHSIVRVLPTNLHESLSFARRYAILRTATKFFEKKPVVIATRSITF